MKALVKSLKNISLIFTGLICINSGTAQTGFKTYKKNPVPTVVPKYFEGKTIYENPYESTKLDYHDFKTQGDWYLKYKRMFDFRCKEPFWGASPKYQKKDYLKSGYLFRLVDSQIVEDSIQFLLNKYSLNNSDTLKMWNLAPSNDNKRVEKIIKRLGLGHFKFVEAILDSRRYSQFIEVPEADQANDNMVYMEIFKYPANVDIFIYNFKINNWEYVESITVSGDHELELHILQKFAPQYLKMYTTKEKN